MTSANGSISGIPHQVSRLVFGTAPFGDRALALFPAPRPTERFCRLLDAVWEEGCNAFDAAAVYQLGGSERLLGAWTRSRGNRDRVVIISKGAHPSIPLFRNRVTPREIVRDLEGSLRRLRTDYVDLYLLHRDDPSVPVGPLVETLHRLREQGKVLAYGASNWSFERVAEANGYAVKSGLTPFAASSPHFSLAEWRRPPYPGCVSIAGKAGAASREWYGKQGMAVLAWSSLAKGFFGASAGVSTPRIRQRAYHTTVNLERFHRVQEMAKKRDVSPSQVALAYVFAQPMEAFAIVSTHSAARFGQNMEAVRLSLSMEEAKWLEQGDLR
jgi:aryl-alcohol dehydrogenase-like predicted oxidoreductase